MRELVPLVLRGETRQNTRQNCPSDGSESRGFSPVSIPVAWGPLPDLASQSFTPSHEQDRLTPEARERHGCCSHGAAGPFWGRGPCKVAGVPTASSWRENTWLCPLQTVALLFVWELEESGRFLLPSVHRIPLFPPSSRLCWLHLGPRRSPGPSPTARLCSAPVSPLKDPTPHRLFRPETGSP